jgi:hypothetical protein
VIPDETYQVFIRLLDAFGKEFKVKYHDGEPSGRLRQDLKALVKKHQLTAWWEKDRKWVSLAQSAGAANLYTHDRAFRHCKDSLESHNIRLFASFPGDKP